MTSTTRTGRASQQRSSEQTSGSCPACSAELDAGTTPAPAIVLCARCCAPLLWDGRYSMLSASEIERLPARNRVRLHTLVALQRARLAASAAPN